MGKGVNGFIKKSLIVGFVGVQGFLSGYLILDSVSVLRSEYITDQARLVEVLQEEKDILGIPDKRIYARFGVAHGGLGHAKKIGEDSYEIVLNPHRGRNSANLKHELYHIADGHLEDLENCSNGIEGLFKQVFIYEPQAVLYQVFGIRL